MRSLRDVPIRQKLARITRLAMAVALGMVAVAFLVLELLTFRSIMTKEMRSMAAITGTNSRAALAFVDPAAGKRTLAAFGADPRIMTARLYTKEGRVFATYHRGDVKPDMIPAIPPSNGVSLRARSLTLVQPIHLDGERIGTIYLQADMAALYDRLLQYALTMIVVLGFASLVALAHSSRLQGMVSGPVTHLAQMVKAVTEQDDYSIRAIKSGQDELGLLTDGFNEMLARIQERDAALQKAREELEERVNLRTQELQLEIAERRRTEEALRKLSRAVEQATDIVLITNREGVIEYVNPAFERHTGYSRDEAIGRTPRLVKSGQQSQEYYERLWQKLLAGEVFHGDFVNRKKDGTLYFEEEIITPLKDSQGAITHFVSAGRDITERKRAEADLVRAHAELQRQTKALRLEVKERTRAEAEARSSQEQLRALTAHLENVREEERTWISREIHDELGQLLTGIKFDLSWVSQRLPDDQDILQAKIRTMGTLIDTTIRSVRRIAGELRPGLLDDLGLMAAIEWQVQEFQSRTGIRTHLTAEPSEIELDREHSTTAFRILQEALTNVAGHAQAAAVSVNLTADAKRLILKVIDNGKGITPQALADRRSFGLLGMRERALLMGGQVTISGRPDQGTTVTLVMPLKRPAITHPVG